MARIFAYCDSPEAATGFGRSAHHVLHALHAAGHSIVQLAVNHDVSQEEAIPWRVYSPSRRGTDPYGLWDLPMVLKAEGPFDVMWTTFDPEVPWSYILPGVEPKMTVLDICLAQRKLQPGFKMAGWFPVDGGPLSGYELGVLTHEGLFDLRATMSTHVHDLIQWTHKLMGNTVIKEKLLERLKTVPHGVDMDLYRIVSDAERADAKEFLGFPRNTFLIVQVERNQQRKQVWRALEVLEKLRQMLPGKPIHLYQHMHMDEERQHARVGWKLDELAWRYGLEAGVDVRWRQGFFSEEAMVSKVYGAADVVLSTSAGEGFQYPVWEALACGRRVVAPNDSARKAWLSGAPGVHLYKADPHGEVVRGGYNRRMSRPDLADACRIIRKMVKGESPKMRECGERSRTWVGDMANVGSVKGWWVDHIAELVSDLEAGREEQGFTVHGEPGTDHVISIRQGPGLGDMLMMLPAIAAFVAERPGETTCLVLPRNDKHAELGTLFNPCDLLQLEDRVPLEQLGENVLDLSTLWHPKHAGGWSDPAVHRTDAVADFLGVPREKIKPLPPMPAEHHITATRAHFVQRYGVHPSNCVAICPQSHNPARSLPEAYVLTVAERIINLGLTPVLAGGGKMQCARVGILNLTGQTDWGGLIGLLGSVGAAICMDSGPLHVAAIQGTPTVALLPLFSADTRLRYYTGDIVAVEPECATLAGESYPPGKDGSTAWASELTPPRIIAALKQLLGMEPEDHPRVLTAEDLEGEA
jgi:ADP-heptose:LPS heptosyltransferase/glycosyltransferase involved in cell wall biosynthesis